MQVVFSKKVNATSPLEDVTEEEAAKSKSKSKSKSKLENEEL